MLLVHPGLVADRGEAEVTFWFAMYLAGRGSGGRRASFWDNFEIACRVAEIEDRAEFLRGQACKGSLVFTRRVAAWLLAEALT